MSPQEDKNKPQSAPAGITRGTRIHQSFEYALQTIETVAHLIDRRRVIRQVPARDWQAKFVLDLPRDGLVLVHGENKLDIGEIHREQYRTPAGDTDTSPQVFDKIFPKIFDFFTEISKAEGWFFAEDDLRLIIHGMHQDKFGEQHLEQYNLATKGEPLIQSHTRQRFLSFDTQENTFSLCLYSEVNGFVFSGFMQNISCVKKPEGSKDSAFDCKIHARTNITPGAERKVIIAPCVLEIDENFLDNFDIQLSEEERQIILKEKEINPTNFHINMPSLFAVFSGNLPIIFLLAENGFFERLDQTQRQRFFDICVSKFAHPNPSVKIDFDMEFWMKMINIYRNHSELFKEITEALDRYNDKENENISEMIQDLYFIPDYVSLFPAKTTDTLANSLKFPSKAYETMHNMYIIKLRYQLSQYVDSALATYQDKAKKFLDSNFISFLHTAQSIFFQECFQLLSLSPETIKILKKMQSLLSESSPDDSQSIVKCIGKLSLEVNKPGLNPEFIKRFNEFFIRFLLLVLPEELEPVIETTQKYLSCFCLGNGRQTVINLLKAYAEECSPIRIGFFTLPRIHNHHHLPAVLKLISEFEKPEAQNLSLSDMIKTICEETSTPGLAVNPNGSLSNIIRLLQFYDAHYYQTLPQVEATSISTLLIASTSEKDAAPAAVEWSVASTSSTSRDEKDPYLPVASTPGEGCSSTLFASTSHALEKDEALATTPLPVASTSQALENAAAALPVSSTSSTSGENLPVASTSGSSLVASTSHTAEKKPSPPVETWDEYGFPVDKSEVRQNYASLLENYDPSEIDEVAPPLNP